MFTYNTIRMCEMASRHLWNILSGGQENILAKKYNLKRSLQKITWWCYIVIKPGLVIKSMRIDIFRFDDNGKIVGHRDVLQVVPDTFVNDNMMF